ncbi:hypothetical protein K1719_044889 [Acacia pycnantha]|nr:hypothetical protein K1719_044889 [Acacia pycnantha]
MDKGNNSSGRRNTKAVKLNLSPPISEQKGRTLVGRFLSISANPLSLAFGFQLRSQREPIWVTVKYEQLQNYYYDCGRIGHEARNCKALSDNCDADETEDRPGNALGTSHVKTLEETVVVVDNDWAEKAGLKPKLSSMAENTTHRGYRVEFPSTEVATPPMTTVSTTTAPILGLSLISTVASRLSRIDLKRRLDLLDDDLTLNPTKKRLTFLELDPNALPQPTPQPVCSV